MKPRKSVMAILERAHIKTFSRLKKVRMSTLYNKHLLSTSWMVSPNWYNTKERWRTQTATYTKFADIPGSNVNHLKQPPETLHWISNVARWFSPLCQKSLYLNSTDSIIWMWKKNCWKWQLQPNGQKPQCLSGIHTNIKNKASTLGYKINDVERKN